MTKNKSKPTVKGYVYICSNPTYENLIKIGMTTKDPKKRVRELDNTSVPLPFKLEHYWTISNTTPHSFESSCHKYLRKYRINQKREFFRLSPDEARTKISIMLNSKGRNHRVTRGIKLLLFYAVTGLVLTTIVHLTWPILSSLLPGS